MKCKYVIKIKSSTFIYFFAVILPWLFSTACFLATAATKFQIKAGKRNIDKMEDLAMF